MSKLKEKIKAVQDVRVEKAVIPEWDVTLELRTMKAIDRARLLKSCVDKEGNVIGERFQAGLIIASCYDPETGEKVFEDGDFEFLMEKSAGVIEYLAGIAMNISGLNRDSLKAAEKNS
jgi:hypothetical protein